VLVARSQSGSVWRQALLAHDVSNGSHCSFPFIACCSCQQNISRQLLRTAANYTATSVMRQSLPFLM